MNKEKDSNETIKNNEPSLELNEFDGMCAEPAPVYDEYQVVVDDVVGPYDFQVPVDEHLVDILPLLNRQHEYIKSLQAAIKGYNPKYIVPTDPF